MDKHELIDKLANDLDDSSTPALGLRARILCWISTMIIVTIVGVLAVGKRGDIALVLEDPRYLIECLAILFAGISAGILALLLTSPSHSTKQFSVTATGAALIWVVSVTMALVLQFDTFGTLRDLNTAGLVCSKKIFLFAVIPALVLIGLLRVGSPLHGKLIGALLLFSAGAIGMLGLQFTCAHDGPIHLMVYHVIPVVGLALIGWFFGRWLCGFEAKIARKRSELFPEEK